MVADMEVTGMGGFLGERGGSWCGEAEYAGGGCLLLRTLNQPTWKDFNISASNIIFVKTMECQV